MKLSVYGILSLVFFLVSCREEPPFIDFSPPYQTKDTTYVAGSWSAPQNKAVLIEDITGVRCNNCPQAAVTAMNILSAKSEDSVVLMALYSKDYNYTLTAPYSGFVELNSSFSSQLIGALGVPVGLPYGYIDRSKFGGSNRWIQPSLWLSKVNERLAQPSPVNITITKTLAGRDLNLKLKFEYHTAVSATHKYALYITESGISSNQLTLGGEVNNYQHNHVLKFSIGNASGNILNAPLVQGRTFEKILDYTIPADFDIDHLHLICVISDSTTEEVVNVRQIEIK